ncbi:response regulator [Thalassoroseus pseudoceratinae]|uniref:response regulator n=1 Tax=Thalassoroseus pseudoceratinae TaxID=2713176 RepID=UPI00141EAE3D|nr:response regulator [Thalassoroseus pseudoceratinae]
MKERFQLLIVDDSPVDRELYRCLMQKDELCTVRTVGDGVDALDQIAIDPPDVILTDLRMPRMNGLELVKQVQERTPEIPVILVTAHGSEEIAAEALRVGAVHYIPKASFAGQAHGTISSVLGIAQERRQRKRLSRCWRQSEYFFELGNDGDLISPLVARLQESLTEFGGTERASVIRIGVALHEALRNAVHHGNLGLCSKLREGDGNEYYLLAAERSTQLPYRDRRVRVHVKESPEEVVYRICDDGDGFDVSNLVYDPTDPANLLRPSGRGLYLIRTFMDEVHFNERGNEITLVHRRGGQTSAGPDQAI